MSRVYVKKKLFTIFINRADKFVGTPGHPVYIYTSKNYNLLYLYEMILEGVKETSLLAH